MKKRMFFKSGFVFGGLLFLQSMCIYAQDSLALINKKTDSIIEIETVIKTAIGVPQEMKRTPYRVYSSPAADIFSSIVSQPGVVVTGVGDQTQYVSLQGTRSLCGDNTPYYSIYGLSFRPLYLNNLGVSQTQLLPYLGAATFSTYVGSGAVLLGSQAVNGVVEFSPVVPDTGKHINAFSGYLFEQHGKTAPRQGMYQSFAPGQPGGFGDVYPQQQSPATISDFFRNGAIYQQEISLTKSDSLGYVKTGIKATNHQFILPQASSTSCAGYLLGERKVKKYFTTRPVLSLNYYQGNNLPQTGFSKENMLFWNAFAPANANFSDSYWQDSTGQKGIDSPDWLVNHFHTKLQSSFVLAGIENEFRLSPTLVLLHHSGASFQHLRMQTTRDAGGAGIAYDKTVESSARDIHHDVSFDWNPHVILEPHVVFGVRMNRSAWTVDEQQSQEGQTSRTLPYSAPMGDQGIFSLVNIRMKRVSFELGVANDWNSLLAKENASLLSLHGGFTYVVKRMTYLPLQKFFLSLYHTPSAMVPQEWLLSSYYTQKEVAGQKISTLSSLKGNPDLKAQVTDGVELGWEGWFGRKAWLRTNLTYYIHTTNNQIMPVRVSGFTGYQYEIQNAASLQNSGLLLGLTMKPIQTKNVSCELFASLSKEKQLLLEIRNGTDYLITSQSSVGPSVGYIQGFDGPRLIGTWNKYTDGHPVQDQDGVYESTFGGNWNINPDFRYQFGFRSAFKKYFVECVFAGQQGGHYWALDEAMAHYTGMDKSAETNPNGAYQQQFLYNHELCMYDASYLDLQKIELGYRFPKVICSLFCQNVATWGLSNRYYHPKTMVLNAQTTPAYQMGSLPLSRYYGILVKITL